jgi:hypothetical protein
MGRVKRGHECRLQKKGHYRTIFDSGLQSYSTDSLAIFGGIYRTFFLQFYEGMSNYTFN